MGSRQSAAPSDSGNSYTPFSSKGNQTLRKKLTSAGAPWNRIYSLEISARSYRKMSHNLNPNAREFVPKGVNSYSAPTGLPAASSMYGVNAYSYPYPGPSPNASYYKNLYVKSLYERNEELERLKKERVDLLKEQESITRKYSDMVCSNVALRKEHNALKAEFETLQQRYDAAEKKTNTINKTTKAVLKENAAFQDQLEQLQAELRHAHEANTELQQTLYSANAKNASLEKSIAHIQEESVKIQQEIKQCFQAEIRALEEELAASKEELAGVQDALAEERRESKAKQDTMQEGITTALQLFTDRCMEAEERKKVAEEWKEQAEGVLITLYNKAATQASETVALQQTLESLFQVRIEENSRVNEILHGYENRILELQAYKGITSTLYIPPFARPPRQQVMNPEEEEEEEDMAMDDPTHDIWALPSLVPSAHA